MSHHLLLIHCPDQKGLIHTITGVIFRLGFNIVCNQEYVDAAACQFFMRTEFAGEGPPQQVIDELQKLLPAESKLRLAPTERRPIVLLATKEPTVWVICSCVIPGVSCPRKFSP